MKYNEKGLTIISLVITIIIMLILLGVTIASSLNGGLFGKAQEAATGTKSEILKEQLQDFIFGKMDVVSRTLEVDSEDVLDNNFTINGTTYKVTAVSEDGDITIELTNIEDNEDKITKKLAEELKIKGVTIEKKD